MLDLLKYVRHIGQATKNMQVCRVPAVLVKNINATWPCLKCLYCSNVCLPTEGGLLDNKSEASKQAAAKASVCRFKVWPFGGLLLIIYMAENWTYMAENWTYMAEN